MRQFFGIAAGIALCLAAGGAQASYASYGPLMCASAAATTMELQNCSYQDKDSGGLKGACTLHTVVRDADNYYLGSVDVTPTSRPSSVGRRQVIEFSYQDIKCKVTPGDTDLVFGCKFQPASGDCLLRREEKDGIKFYKIHAGVVPK